MNYKPNKIVWSVGDLVIHDSDEKTTKMLMRVVDTIDDGRIKTRYVNMAGSKPYYLNPIEVLHDPAKFDIDIRAQCFSEDNLGEMKLYVWTGFCPDAIGGLAVAIATTVEEAKKLVEADHLPVCVWGWGTLTIHDIEKYACHVDGGVLTASK